MEEWPSQLDPSAYATEQTTCDARFSHQPFPVGSELCLSFNATIIIPSQADKAADNTSIDSLPIA